VAIPLQTIIKGCKTVNEITNILITTKYPPKDAFKYFNEISQIQQDEFLTIQEYYDEPELKISILGCSRMWSRERIDEKIEEIFYQNLSPTTQVELARHGIDCVASAIKIISQTEEILIKTHKRSIQEHEPRWADHSYTRCEELPKTANNFKASQKEKEKKWCNVNKTNTHDTKDCRKLKEEKRSNNENKTYGLIEQRPKIGMIRLEAYICGIKANVILDSGSNYSYIPEGSITKLKLKPKNTTAISLETADGRNVTVNSIADSHISFEEIPNARYKLSAYILKTTGKDVILGSDFLSINYVIFDYAKLLVNIDGHEIELPSDKTTDYQSPDLQLSDKTKIYTVDSSSEKMKLDDIISGFKKQNPILGTIKETCHEITLKDTTPIQCKSYPIPQKHREKTLTEIESLLHKKVIRESNSKFASPAYPILKRNDEIRLFIDYRKLNAQTLRNHSQSRGYRRS
jgi:hypothetical protein